MSKHVPIDRDRGILTKDDREYLFGEKTGYSDGTEYNTKRRIRERVENALLDFAVLFEGLEPKERAKIFSVNDTVTEERPLPTDAVRHAIAFLFLGLTDNSSIEKREGSHHSPAFETELRIGLREGYLERDILLDECELLIESREVPSLEAVRKILEEGGSLPSSMRAALVASEAVSGERVDELLQEELLNSTPDGE